MSLSSASGPSLDANALLDDPGAFLAQRVLRAARVLLAERGLSVSMDDIAEAAGVSRRSLFRHFASRDALLAEALSSSLDWYERHAQPETDGEEQPFDEWLQQTVARLHRLHGSAGRGLWQLAAADPDDLPAELRAVDDRRRLGRRATTERLAREAWRRAGGRGPCPRVVIDAFALTISTFVTRSMLDDFDAPVERLVESTVGLLAALLDRRISAR
jgi:AcrR family transcriptional regulator